MGMVESLELFARVFAGQDAPASVRWIACAARQREKIGRPIAPCHRAEHAELLAMLRKALVGEAFATSWSTGEALTLNDAVAKALEAVEKMTPLNTPARLGD
jgi:hypothetical protein